MPSSDRLEPMPDPSAASRRRTTIALCGSLAVRIGGRCVSELPGRQGRALFAYLVLNRDRPVSRDEMIDVLWPDNPPAAPDAAFASVLARVRQAVGRDVIEGRGQLSLRLEPDAEVDCEAAGAATAEGERLLREGDPEGACAAAERARRIVARPLMPGLEAPWLEAARGELSDLEARALEVMARAALLLDSLDGAAAARALVERHPYRESGYTLLMELQAHRGDVAEAITTFHRLRTFLLDELGTGPSAAARALYERLLREGGLENAPSEGPAGAAPPVPLPLMSLLSHDRRFVGREESQKTLHSSWQQSVAGHRRLALLVGEAGIGKTRIAAQFAAEAHAAGATVLYGRCEEDPIRSYEPFVAALRHYLRHGDWTADTGLRRELRELARLIPEAWPEAEGGAGRELSSSETERSRLFDAVVGLIDRAAQTRPLLLVLDDLHWADKPTLLLLRHLLRQIEPVALLIVGSFRATEVADDHPLLELVADLRRERRFDRIALEGLDEHETETLIADRLSTAASPAFVRELRARTEGNPFFIEESLRALAEAHAIQSGKQASEHALNSIGVPDGVAGVILRRLGRVSEITRDALTAAAVIGREFDLGPARVVIGESFDHVIEAMEDAIAAGLVVEVPGQLDRFSFCHALVREAIYGRLSTSRRLRLHLRVGDALEAGAGIDEPNAVEMAHHFFLARELGCAERAVRYAMLAGEEATTAAAYEEAADHYRRALTALEVKGAHDESKRCEVLLALGRAQWQAGEAGARNTYLQVAESARSRGASEQLARAALGLGERYWEANMVDEQYRRLLGEVLPTLGEEESTVRARLMARLAENLHFTAEQQHGVHLSAEALEIARRLGDPATLVKTVMARHVVLLHTDHLEERLRLIEEVLQLTRGHRGLSAEAHHWRVFDLCEAGEIAAARRGHAELATLAAQLRQPLLQYVATGWRGVFAHLDGDVEQAEGLAAESFALAQRANAGDARSSYAAKLLTPRRQQGRLDELMPVINSMATTTGMAAWRAVLAVADVEVGNVVRGRAGYDRLLASDLAAVPRDWYWLTTVALLAEVCCALDDADGAALLYERLMPYADRHVQVSIAVSWGSLQRHLGMLADLMECFDVAEAHFESALERNRRCGALLMLAESQCAYGAMLLRRRGNGDRARAAALGAAAEQVAVLRALDDLCRRARALQVEAPDGRELTR